jgi:hypothetical protein
MINPRGDPCAAEAEQEWNFQGGRIPMRRPIAFRRRGGRWNFRLCDCVQHCKIFAPVAETKRVL